MFRPTIVPRPTEGGRRATGDIPDALRGVLHHEALARDLGIDPKAGHKPPPAPRSAIGAGTLIGILFLTFLMFATILIVLLWRDGRLSTLFPAEPKPVAHGPKTDWMLSGHAPRTEDDAAASSSSMLPAATPVGPQASQDSEDETIETDAE